MLASSRLGRAVAKATRGQPDYLRDSVEEGPFTHGHDAECRRRHRWVMSDQTAPACWAPPLACGSEAGSLPGFGSRVIETNASRSSKATK